MAWMGVVRWVHIVAGVVSLAAAWIPLVARKGGVVHRRAGWVYSIAMWTGTAGAWILCAERLVDDDATNDAMATFLAFVGLLTANGAATGIRVLRSKGREQRGRSVIDVASSCLFLGAALALGAWGIARRSGLDIAFALLGIFLSARQLGYWLAASRTKADWWTMHLGNMLAACIGTVTAFLVVNVPRFGLEAYATLLWLAPGVIGGFAIAALSRYYRRRLGARSLEARASTARTN